MNGGEKILNRIKSDCDKEIKTIENRAYAKRNEIMAKASAKAEKEAKAIGDKAVKKVSQLNASSKSRAELEIRNALLKQRRAEIDETVKELEGYLLNLGDSEYFEYLYSLAATLPNAEGEILLNEKDKNRMPSDFTERLAQKGVRAAVSDKTADIAGGFILKNGDIEENMEFSAVIAAKRDSLEDYINRELFAE